MKIKKFDVDENGNIVVVCDINDISGIIRDCTEETQSYNEKTRELIEKFVNDMIKTKRLSTILSSLDFLKKFKINIDTSVINLADYDFNDIVNIYTILTKLDAVNEIKDAIKNEIITKYNRIYEIDNIYKILSIANENNDREFVEFLVKDVISELLTRFERSVEYDFEDWIEKRIDVFNKFSYLIRVLEIIYQNNLQHLIENEIKIFRDYLLSLCEKREIDLKRLLKRRINSKMKDDAIVLINVLNDDELKRYLIISSLNE